MNRSQTDSCCYEHFSSHPERGVFIAPTINIKSNQDYCHHCGKNFKFLKWPFQAGLKIVFLTCFWFIGNSENVSFRHMLYHCSLRCCICRPVQRRVTTDSAPKLNPKNTNTPSRTWTKFSASEIEGVTFCALLPSQLHIENTFQHYSLHGKRGFARVCFRDQATSRIATCSVLLVYLFYPWHLINLHTMYNIGTCSFVSEYGECFIP
ncbi:uncharacterized protein LOC126204291 [Schistocerca nitens]|uniref:uncharacterized protein LOC126204291 n=1 Tax=Schistocerca nitens TaxID=7011 RepID=UPI002117A96F|nr:uncharacterized protein LOC126204291 [Schistocerca nitens]